MGIETGSIDAMLSLLKASTAIAEGKSASAADGTNSSGGADFSQVLKNTLDQVNQAQQTAQKMSQDFAAGDTNVNLQDVMINLQKANLSFQEMVQVRNKLVSAYHDIMSIQV